MIFFKFDVNIIYMKKENEKKIRVVELFAGVGGFRIGLSNNSLKNYYEFVWSNQWEPATKQQHASDIYTKRFGDKNHSNKDIAKIHTEDIPHHDMLVGGFPCQDYSVAKTLKDSNGITGKKGVLWWSIYRILKEKGENSPRFLMLENVDRLLKSPAIQRGRDFAIMLTSLSDLGYAVEWRVINAAEYGMPQKRKRVYILGYKKNTKIYKELKENDKENWLKSDGIFAKAFSVKKEISISSFDIKGSLQEITKTFNNKTKKSPFDVSGVMIDRKIYTAKVIPNYKGEVAKLKNYIEAEENISREFFINEKDIEKWKYLKGGKKEERIAKNGFKYIYSEGAMQFPDDMHKPARTIVTGEGGTSPSRFKHVILTNSGKYRRLTPIELERINMFPENHTSGVSDTKRAFLMGNALVVGIVTAIGKELYKRV